MKKIFQILVFLGLGVAAYKKIDELSHKKKESTIPLKNSKPVHFFKKSLHPVQSISHNEKLWEQIIWFLIFTFLVLILFQPNLDRYSNWLKSSVLDVKQVEFTGTTFPVKKVPNWVQLTDAERKMSYSQLPKNKIMDIPEYNLSDLQKGRTWKPDNEKERNAYITYPVPNLGNYKLDGNEGAGSHPGMDIKIPVGTPIYAFASGTAVKVENQTTGFGKFILLSHAGFPDPKNPENKITIYSLYAHLSHQSVRVGDVVKKGDLIGKSGNTGMATAPHLHFQIEHDTAPFHPYWPFTWKDLKASGITSYFDAVNRGVGRENAKKHTLHPVELVKQFHDYQLNTSLLVDSGADNLVVTADEKIVVNNLPESNSDSVEDLKASAPTETEISTVDKKEVSHSGKVEIKIDDRVFVPGKTKSIQVLADPSLLASGSMNIDSTLGYLAQIEPSKLTPSDFSGGVANIDVTTSEDKIFKVVATGSFGEVKSKSLLPRVFTDVSNSHSELEAISYLKEKKIVNGYSDGSFKPESNITRAEAVKILIEANSFKLLPAENNFADVSVKEWFSGYVSTALARGLLKGYPDGSFKPGKNISRAEFLKITLEANGNTLETLLDQSYPDVPNDAWFAKYFQFAKTHEILKPKVGGYIVPHQPITRAEAARVIWKLSGL